LNLSDVDAVWAIHDASNPATITCCLTIIGSWLERPRTIGATSGQSLVWGLYGKPNRIYVIDSTSDFRQWTGFLTNTTSANGFFQFSYDAPAALAPRFFRARLQP